MLALKKSNIDFIFCGGCKLKYDRDILSKLLEKELIKLKLRVLVVMNGCFKACEKVSFYGYDKIIEVNSYLDLINKDNNPEMILNRILKDMKID